MCKAPTFADGKSSVSLFIFFLDHCSPEDVTPTFSSHVESRRFRRAVEELYLNEAHLQTKPKEKKKMKKLQAKKKPAEVSVVVVKNEETLSNSSEQEEMQLKKRVDFLEKKVESMTATIKGLQDAFNSLQSQASECTSCFYYTLAVSSLYFSTFNL